MMNWCQKARISPINPSGRSWLSTADGVDDDAMVAMARSAGCRAIFVQEKSP
jgi:hypothetical protein